MNALRPPHESSIAEQRERQNADLARAQSPPKGKGHGALVLPDLVVMEPEALQLQSAVSRQRACPTRSDLFARLHKKYDR